MDTITQDELKAHLVYSPATGLFTRKVSRCGNAKKGSIAGRITTSGHRQIRVNYRAYMAHRLAFLYMTGKFPEDQVDHINHIPDDNRWENLRAVSQLENGKNQSKSRVNKSGVTGVSWRKRENKWCASIKANSEKAIHLGVFPDKFEAVCARKSAENKLGFHKNHGT